MEYVRNYLKIALTFKVHARIYIANLNSSAKPTIISSLNGGRFSISNAIYLTLVLIRKFLILAFGMGTFYLSVRYSPSFCFTYIKKKLQETSENVVFARRILNTYNICVHLSPEVGEIKSALFAKESV